ncbi:energy transducer TonB [Novosphingobium anseongense]|uniref:energy transducer TonB n=1 Tax=Novosphingobium anseongense TaxID=3133436 RepID=UPI003A952770
MWKAALLIGGLLTSSVVHAKSLRRASEPIGGPRSWESQNDYPSRAIREQVGGTTSFRLTVRPDGSVSNCEITVSSGHENFDQATCWAALQRARFAPARDKAGRPTIGTFAYYRQWIPPVRRYEH